MQPPDIQADYSALYLWISMLPKFANEAMFLKLETNTKSFISHPRTFYGIFPPVHFWTT